MTMYLSQYPRPPADTGWGFHDSAGVGCRPPDAAAYARYLRRDLGVTWFKVLAGGTNKVDLVQAFTGQGIECVVRLYANQPHPHYVVSEAEVRAYVQAGAHYFEWGNEPNLLAEWEVASWNEGARVDKVCEQFLRNAEVIRRAGGIPMLPALSPGGDYPHRDWYRTTFEWLRINGHIADLQGAAVAIHNRPINHPLSYTDNSGVYFLDYEWIDDLVRQYTGQSLPLVGTEGGYEPFWDQDATFPRIDLGLHAAYNVEILRNFGPNGSRKWRDALFAVCMWIVDNWGHAAFAETAWHHNGTFANGADLPAVAALRAEWAAHPFQRSWSWDDVQPEYTGATWRGSPNARPRPVGTKPAMLALAATGADYNEAMQQLRDPASGRSLHYVISRSGAIYQLVQEASCAAYAQGASWNGHAPVDDSALAIGLVNRNDGIDSYPGAQIDATAKLVQHLLRKHSLTLADVATGTMIKGGAADPAGFDLAAFKSRVELLDKPWPTDDETRTAAWAAAGLAYNAQAAFPAFARAHNLGNPETAEFDFELDGVLYRGQGYSEGIVYCEHNHWDALQIMAW